MPEVTDPPEPDRARAALSRAERLLEALKIAGWSPGSVDRFVEFWKRFGLARALLLAIAILAPTIKYAVAPRLASGAVATLAEGYGIDVEVRDWSFDLIDLRLTAHDIKVRTRGQYGRPEIVTADAASADVSLVRWWRTRRWVQDIDLDGPSLYLEHLLSGRWNAEDVVDPNVLSASLAAAQPRAAPQEGGAWERLDTALRICTFGWFPAPDSAAEPAFDLKVIRASGLHIEWVENLPGESGGGIIHRSKASIYIDDVKVLVEELAGPIDGRDKPTRFTIDGRTADGVFSVKGQANFFRWRAARPGLPAPRGPLPGLPPPGPIPPDLPPRDRVVSQPAAPAEAAPASGAVWSPAIDVDIYLENVSVAAFGRMLAPASLVPSFGSAFGWIRLKIEDTRVECATDLTVRNYGFAANPASPAVQSRGDRLQRALDDLRLETPVLGACSGDLRDEQYRPFYAINDAVVATALQKAPPVVREVAAYDQAARERSLSGALADAGTAAVATAVTEQMSKAAGRLLGQSAGAAFSESLQGGDGSTAQDGRAGQRAGDQPGGNAITRGVRGVGSGIKRLFGGGRSDKK